MSLSSHVEIICRKSSLLGKLPNRQKNVVGKWTARPAGSETKGGWDRDIYSASDKQTLYKQTNVPRLVVGLKLL